MTLPPLDDGMSQLTRALSPLVDVTTTLVGTEGTVSGATDALGSDDGPVPTPLVAATVNEYEVPLSSPAITVDVAVVVADIPLSEVTV